MTIALATKQDQELTTDRVDRGLEWLTRSLPSLRDCPDTQRMAEANIADLTVPAHPAEILARVMGLLSPYWDKDAPQSVKEMEAEDWVIALKEYPYWAIERACRWWRNENTDRRKRPMEGDIAARCYNEMDAVNAARLILVKRLRKLPAEPTRPERSDAQSAATRARMSEIEDGVLKSMGAATFDVAGQ